jgi:hypothetical protein
MLPVCEIATRTHLFRPYNSKDTSFFVAHNSARVYQVSITDGMEQTYSMSMSMLYARYRGAVRRRNYFFIPVQCVEYDIQTAPIKEMEEYKASG